MAKESRRTRADVKPGTMYSATLVRCPLKTVQPTDSTGPTYAAQSAEPLTGSSTSAMFGGAPTEKRPWPGPGLRMVGSYRSAGGLSLEFHEDSVMVGPRKAFSSSCYTVGQSGNKLVVQIENRPERIALQARFRRQYCWFGRGARRWARVCRGQAV